MCSCDLIDTKWSLVQFITWYQTGVNELTHWGQVTHICISKLTIIGSDNGLSPGRRPAIIWTNAGILLIGPLGTNFSKILVKVQNFLLIKTHVKISSAKWWPFLSRGRWVKALVNGHYFADISKFIFLNENHGILTAISIKCVPVV